MEAANLRQPEMVGRPEELDVLDKALSDAFAGRGSTLFICGEAGIGKTRLASELMSHAEHAGARVLRGWCLPECLEPLMPIKEALRTADLQGLMTGTPPPRMLALYLLNDAGMLLAKADREETGIDADIFAAMLRAVSSFITDSLGMMGRGGSGGVSAIEQGDYKILVQSAGRFSLAAVVQGDENEFLIEDMNRLLADIDPDADADSIDTSTFSWMEARLRKLIDSAKYDGDYVHDDPRIKQENMFDNVLLGLQRAALDSPVLFFLDDMQWADPSTLALMHYLARNTRESRIMMLATYRPEDIMARPDGTPHHLETVMHNMSRESLFNEVKLRRFGAGETEKIVLSALGAAELPPELGARIQVESEGNPFFTLEVVRMLVEEGLLVGGGDAWSLTAGVEDMQLPSKIYDVIRRRLNRLSKTQYGMLECASVVGEVFGSDVIGRVLSLERMSLLRELNDLEKVHRVIRSRGPKYGFDHSKIREVLYDSINGEMRAEFHRMIGDAFSVLAADGRDVTEELAYHYSEAGDARAVGYLIRAGDGAREKYSNEEAIRFYRRAVELSGDSPEPRLFGNLGDLLTIVGRCDEAISAYEKALEFTEDMVSCADIYNRMSLALERASEYDRGITAAAQGLELLGTAPHPTRSKLLSSMTWNLIRQSEYDRALELQRESLENAARLEDRTSIATSHHLMGTIAWFRGDFDAAREHYMSALAIQREQGDDRHMENTLNNLGVLFMETGRLDEALQYFEEGLVYEEMVGDKSGMAGTIDNLGNLYHTKGDVDKALGYHLRSLELYRKAGDTNGIAWSLSSLGYIYPDMGNVRRGIACHEESVSLCEDIGDQHMLIYNYYGLADSYSQLGNFGLATKFVEKALALSKELGARREEGASTYIWGIIQRGLGKYDEAARMFALAREILADVGDTSLLAMIDYDEGLLMGLMGNPGEARRLLEKAEKAFSKMGMGLWLRKTEAALSEAN